MNAPTVADAARRKKRLGQYFTALPLATFLAFLAEAHDKSSILDPMAGEGDMLLGAIAAGADPSAVHGFEIDPPVAARARSRLGAMGGANIRTGDAFLGGYRPEGYDLVITNPPYIRYQRVAGADGLADEPTARHLRSRLLQEIGNRENLNSTDRLLFTELAKGYSGHADVAVPSWLLSASLVKEGGTLAILVPQTWLSRDYASGIRRLLADLFEAEFIINDDSANWFADAQVRTSMIVARRKGPVGRTERTASGRTEASFRTVESTKRFLEDPEAPAIWASMLKRIATHGGKDAIGGFTAERVEFQASNFLRADRSKVRPRLSLEALAPFVHQVGASESSMTLAQLGWAVGQGLRTGANAFFYADSADSQRGDGVELRSKLLAHSFAAPATAVVPVLRRQAELPTHGFRVRADDLQGRLLYLRSWAMPSDILEHSLTPDHKIELEKRYSALPPSVHQLIHAAAKHRPSAHYPERALPELSAVRTNVRRAEPADPTSVARFWYHLPELRERHRPRLVLARVIGGAPRTYVLDESGLIVDANFSTLWPTSEAALPELAMLALANSSLFELLLESYGTVLGGGALKVEASLISQLALPNVLAIASELERLGQHLVASEASKSAREDIDRAVLSTFCSDDEGALYRIRSEIDRRRALRTRPGKLV